MDTAIFDKGWNENPCARTYQERVQSSNYSAVKSRLTYRANGEKGNAVKELNTALEALGVKGKVEAFVLCTGRIMVYVNDEYFGIWDIKRKTFVD